MRTAQLGSLGYARATSNVDFLINDGDLPSGNQWPWLDPPLPGYASKVPRPEPQPAARRCQRARERQFPGDGLPKPVAFPTVASAPKGEVPDVVEGPPVLPLAVLVELKLASGTSATHRAKDLADVQELIKAVGLPRECSGELNYSLKQAYVTLWDQVNAGRKAGLE